MFIITEVIEKAEAMIKELKEIKGAHEQGDKDFPAYLKRVEGIAAQIKEVRGFLGCLMCGPVGLSFQQSFEEYQEQEKARDVDIDSLLHCIMFYQDGDE